MEPVRTSLIELVRTSLIEPVRTSLIELVRPSLIELVEINGSTTGRRSAAAGGTSSTSLAIAHSAMCARKANAYTMVAEYMALLLRCASVSVTADRPPAEGSG